ncbi:glutathione transferase [Ranunculus cassubicifolius]
MANQSEVKLVSMWCSPFGRRIEWVLQHKGIQYEYLEEDLFNKSPYLLEVNPVYKKIPVLIHGGNAISESFVMLEYIDEVWPQNPIMPSDPYEKSQVRFWAKFVEDKITEGVLTVLRSEGEECENNVKEFVNSMEILEGHVKKKEGKFFGGDSIGYLDIVLGWTTHWLSVVEQVSGTPNLATPENFPCFNKWKEDFISLPLIKNCVPPREKIVAYLTNGRKLALAAKQSK